MGNGYISYCNWKSVQNGAWHLVLLKVLRDISAGECHPCLQGKMCKELDSASR